MPRKKKAPEKKRRPQGTGSIVWMAARQRWRARLPKTGEKAARESLHLTRDDAEAWIVREVTRSPDSFDPLRPLGEYLAYWYNLRRDRWGEQTQRRYLYEMAAVGDLRLIPLYRLRGDQVAAAQAAILRRGCTRRYTYNVISLLNRALADAVKWRLIDSNPVDTDALPEPEHRVTQAWELDELRAVLSAIVGHRFEAVYLLILWGALRIGEVVALRWNQIEDDGTVAFNQAEHTQIRGRPIGSTKRERERETQLPSMVIDRLRVLRAAGPHPMDFPARPMAAVAYVYVAQRPDGNRWTARQIRDEWKELVAGVRYGHDGEIVKQLRPHGGRRTAGTMHMVAGTPLADVSKLLGHSSPATTAQSYLGSSRRRRQDAANRLAALIGTPEGTVEGPIEGTEGR